jgi:hypothetical protein
MLANTCTHSYLILFPFFWLCFSDAVFCFLLFLQIEDCSTSTSCNLWLPFLLNVFLFCVSVSHFSNSHNYANCFIIIVSNIHVIIDDLSEITFAVTMVIIALGLHKSCPHNMVNVINKCCVPSDFSTPSCFSISLPILGLPYSRRQQYWN